MEVFIVTGASKGIGLALCRQLVEAGHIVFGIARSKNSEWNRELFYEFDLTDLPEIPGLVAKIASALPENVQSITLINNAGTIEPIGFSGQNDPLAIQANINLNLTAPMILSSSFIAQFKNVDCIKSIVNISSGAGRKVYRGWSAYCASKAGLDHFSRVLDAEEDDVKVVAVAPGIIDTGMQEQIRKSNELDFPLLGQFQDYKDTGKLSTPEETAAQLIKLLRRPDFLKLDPILDLRALSAYKTERTSEQ
ncbi:benzil reductase ((S)-benzoin forming) [Planomicrobium soli]|uniref:Benzil reductase ((S)-benzoin forming) n=1 Tax=Planomicrobium soli TaxID=1176648 RepID=A0A2P8H6V6_9BACL|nr:SDR family NAD(P)-dependent oxidoreductase [Planomicrobium soli]PSL41930.1 benzil reductase ((S)-benzoin forming) [Planomicrobium soli]